MLPLPAFSPGIRSPGSVVMTDFDEIVTSSEAFEAVMEDVLLAAIRNGINPHGSWVFRNRGHTPDMEVLITELKKRDEA